jgi:maleate isomerase
VVAALRALHVRRVAIAAPYDEDITSKCRFALESRKFEVVKISRLDGVEHIYSETPERAYALACAADTPDADAIFLPGTGLPTIDVLDVLERDLGKPVVSSTSAMMWNALSIAGVSPRIPGYGRLLDLRY